MKGKTKDLLLVAVIALAPCGALGRELPFEGNWIWDPEMYVEAPNWGFDAHIVAETLTVTRDDGRRYAARLQQVWDTGSIVYDEAFAEDGADHPLGGQGATQSISVLQDGGRRIVSSSGKGGRYAVSICHVSADAMTMTCQGELHTPDGRAGAFQCGYHRDDAAPPAPAATAP